MLEVESLFRMSDPGRANLCSRLFDMVSGPVVRLW